MANFTPYHTYLPTRSIVGIYSFCSLKHFGLLFPCFSHCKRSKIFLEAFMSLSIQHNLHSLELQRITLWYWDILAFPLTSVAFGLLHPWRFKSALGVMLNFTTCYTYLLSGIVSIYTFQISVPSILFGNSHSLRNCKTNRELMIFATHFLEISK